MLVTLVTSKALPSVPAPLLQSWYLLCDLLSVISSVSPPAAYLVIWSQDKSLKLPTTTHFTTQPTQGHRLFAQFLHKTTQVLDKIFISVHCILHHLYNISLMYMIAFYIEHFYTGHRKIWMFSWTFGSVKFICLLEYFLFFWRIQNNWKKYSWNFERKSKQSCKNIDSVLKGVFLDYIVRSLVHFEYNVAHKEKVHSIVFTGLYHHSLLHSKISKARLGIEIAGLEEGRPQLSMSLATGAWLGYFHRE